MLNEGLNTDGITAYVVLGIIAGLVVVGLVKAIIKNIRKK